MENASKTLLIAVGMKIYSSTTDAQKVGINTGKTISDKTGEATDLVVGEIIGNKIKYYSGETNNTKG